MCLAQTATIITNGKNMDGNGYFRKFKSIIGRFSRFSSTYYPKNMVITFLKPSMTNIL